MIDRVRLVGPCWRRFQIVHQRLTLGAAEVAGVGSQVVRTSWADVHRYVGNPKNIGD